MKVTCITTFHPAAILREWSWRAIALNDLRRAKRYRDGIGAVQPLWRFVLSPNFHQVMEVLSDLLSRLDAYKGRQETVSVGRPLALGGSSQPQGLPNAKDRRGELYIAPSVEESKQSNSSGKPASGASLPFQALPKLGTPVSSNKQAELPRQEISEQTLTLDDLRERAGDSPSVPEKRSDTQVGRTAVQSTQKNRSGDSKTTEGIWVDFDLETRAGHIACAGLSWSRTDAISIPFMCQESREGYWNEEEEAIILQKLYQVLTHENVRVRGQNLLYDCQYTYRWWHFAPRVAQDTMISQHTLFCILPKSLAFQASMYADWYVYWKDEGKTWQTGMGEKQLWGYNCLDCVYTREVGEVEQQTIRGFGLEAIEAFQQKLFWPVLKAMNRGLRVDIKARSDLALKLMQEIAKREQYFIDILGHPLNTSSPKQMIQLFYTDLQQQAVMSRAKKGAPAHITCDDEALTKIGQRELILKPLVEAIADIRTLGVLLSTFVNAKLDIDGRMRCSFNIAGNTEGRGAPATYRLSSSQNAFDSGANLQNIPSDKSKMQGKSAKRDSLGFTLPNIRRLYIPDPGFTFFDMDLDRADLQVVVWESDDAMLKTALRIGADIHLLNVYSLDGQEAPPLDELVETHPKYPDHRGPRKLKREFAKVFCHATNYVGSAKTVAGHTGRTVHEVDRAQKLWFSKHPGIKAWHARTQEQISKRRFVENKFGYRWYIFDRPDGLLPEAVAWIPQSTVACTINRVWLNIYENLPEVEVLLQVHDSLAGQFPSHQKEFCIRRLKGEAQIIIPYDDPLVIPVGIKTSERSWGECV